MKNPFAKFPFLFLLIPLLAGILLQYYIKIAEISIVLFLIGTATMLSSFLLSEKAQFRWRWLFGIGVLFFVMGLGIASTSYRQQRSAYIFSVKSETYRGIVTETPQVKAKSIAYKIYLPDEDKQIVCYLQKDSLRTKSLNPGDEILFQGQIQPFKNMGNPDDFDYVRYMYNQGFAGSVYLSEQSWYLTGIVKSSLKYQALCYRQKILDFYQSLDFNEEEYSILSALTLGYQDELSDDLKQAFRTTGTVHVLSVSGLHVGIIYLMISFLLGFISRDSKCHWLKPVLIILLLWMYAFITGLPPSVVRASIMLSVFCASQIFGKKSFALHTLFITAFFMLLYNPFSIFDIGFQLSFISVLSILLLQPAASGLLKVDNTYIRYVWQMFTLSIVAQLATFPICLYYFGTFPTYFFIANLFIVPLVSLITYAMGGVILAKLLTVILPDLSYYLYFLPVKVLQFLVYLMTSIIDFIENIPFALVNNVKITFTDLFLIFSFIVSILIFLYYRKSKALIIALTATFIFVSIHTLENLKPLPNNLIVYNKRQATEIKWNNGNKENILRTDDLISGYKLIEIKGNKTLVVSSDIWKSKLSESNFEVDNLVLTTDNSLSLYSLTLLFTVKNVVLDASLSVYTRRKIAEECQKLNIPCHDVVLKGAFSLNF